MKLPTLPVQNLVDNEGTSSSAPASSPDWDMLAKFQPTEPWVAVPPEEERRIIVGCIAILTAMALGGYVIYRVMT